MGRDGRNIAGQEMFARADAEDERTAPPRADHDVGLVLVDGDEAVGAGDFPERLHHGHFQAVFRFGIERVEVKSDQKGKHLGVRFRAKLKALVYQPLLQGAIVFDDTVVDDGQLAGGVGMGVGVDLGGLAVGGPARVADPEAAVEGMAAQRAFQLLDAAHFLDHREALAVEHGNPARIVTPVLETVQPLQQERLGFLIPNIGNNSAHNLLVATIGRQRQGWGVA